jgi:membrane-bound serine protease (ClpP class)
MTLSMMHSLRIRLTGLFLLSVLPLATLLAPGASAERPQVRVLDVDGLITPMMVNYIRSGIQHAERVNDSAVVLQMDTPGGLSSAVDDIVQDILGSKVPVVVYVAPSGARAASAGVYITYAAQVAAMAPSTNIGSTTPVFLDQSGQAQGTDEAMTRKVVNDSIAKIQGLASLRGRNAEWAAGAVQRAENITADEAFSMNVVDLVAPDLLSLLNALDGRSVAVPGGEVALHTRDAAVITEPEQSQRRVHPAEPGPAGSVS